MSIYHLVIFITAEEHTVGSRSKTVGCCGIRHFGQQRVKQGSQNINRSKADRGCQVGSQAA